jgi:hypothetical protein
MPKFAQKDPKFRRRYLFFFLSGLLRALSAYCYIAWGTVFVYVPRDYQWIIGILTPILREFLIWILLEINYRAAATRDDPSVKLTSFHHIASR